jgi:transposase-like protein
MSTKHVRIVSNKLKEIHASEDREAALAKSEAGIEKLEAMRLKEAVAKVLKGIEKTLTFYRFLALHCRQIRTNNPLERIMREMGDASEWLASSRVENRP